MRRAILLILGCAAFAPSAAFAQGHVTTIVLSPASPVAPGTNVTVTVSATAPCAAIEINFGDGTDVPFPTSALPLVIPHAYPNPGTFTIAAKGQGNCSGQASTTLQVRQGSVTGVTFSPASPVAPGTAVNVTVAASAPCTTMQVDFGDGTLQVFQVNGLPFHQTHTYSVAGTFTVRAAGLGDCTGQASAVLVVAVPQPTLTDLTVTLTVASPSVTGVADLVAVQAHNGAAAASGVTVRVTLNGGWGLPAAGPGAGCTPQINAPDRIQLLCTVGDMAPQAVKTLQLSAIAPSRVVRGQTVSVVAEIDPGNAVPESNETNNTATVPVSLEERADLVADGSALPLTATVGQDLTYPVRVRNTGDASATNVGVRVFLPKQVDFVRADGTEIGNCTTAQPVPGTTIVNCTAPTILPGATATVNLVTKPIQGLVDGDKIQVTVQVDPFNAIVERDESNNTVTVQTTLTVPTDLAIVSVTVERRPADSPPRPGDTPLSCKPDRQPTIADARAMNTIVHVLIKNLGPGQTTSATASVTWAATVFPPSASDCAVSTHCAQGICTVGATPVNPALCFVQCAIPAIFPGLTAEIIFYADRTNDPAVLGTVTLDPNHAVNDPNRANNSQQIR